MWTIEIRRQFSRQKATQIFSETTPTDRIVIQILHARYIFIFIRPQSEKPRALFHIASSPAGRNVKFGRGTRAAFFHLVTRAIWRSPLRGLFLHEKLIGAVLIVRAYTRPLPNYSLSQALKDTRAIRRCRNYEDVGALTRSSIEKTEKKKKKQQRRKINHYTEQRIKLLTDIEIASVWHSNLIPHCS